MNYKPEDVERLVRAAREIASRGKIGIYVNTPDGWTVWGEFRDALAPFRNPKPEKVTWRLSIQNPLPIEDVTCELRKLNDMAIALEAKLDALAEKVKD